MPGKRPGTTENMLFKKNAGGPEKPPALRLSHPGHKRTHINVGQTFLSALSSVFWILFLRLRRAAYPRAGTSTCRFSFAAT
jgi:hypothetical protein